MLLGEMYFQRSTIFDIFALHTERKRCGQMVPTPCYSQNQVVSACHSFRPVAPSFILAKIPFFGSFFFLFFFNTERGVAI